MSQPSPFAARAWILVLLLAVAFTVWDNWRRIARLDQIANLTRGESVPTTTSATGYARGVRERVLPDHDNPSYKWIAQTQRALATGEWRIRQISDENAPYGHLTHAASPYRWWFAMLAWMDSRLSGRSPALAVERVSLYVDPALHLLLLLGTTWFAARYFGPWSAALVAIGGAFLFPFTARFHPGVPEPSTLEVTCAIFSLLAVSAAVQRIGTQNAARSQSWIITAGLIGGIGVWVNPASQVPVILGIAVGAVIIGWFVHSSADSAVAQSRAQWRVWALAGATTVLFASLFEYYPGYLGAWELRALHPLYGLGWLGLGELLAGRTGWAATAGAANRYRALTIKLLALLAFLAVPALMYKTGNAGFWAVDEVYYRLVNQPGGIVAPNLLGWIREGGFSLPLAASLLPVALVIPATALTISRKTSDVLRAQLALAIGPVLLAAVLASLRIRHWLLLDAALLVLLVVTTRAVWATTSTAGGRSVWCVGVAVVLLPSVFQLMPRKSSADNSLALPQVVGVVERDLAHWLVKHSSDGSVPVVLAPPKLTTTLNYYGGLPGVGTLSWENEEGLAFGIRIAVSTSPNETAALLRKRGVTHIVMPSWHPFYEPYLQAASVQVAQMFYSGLSRWSLPPWLKPVPYQLPSIGGFETQSVRIFELVEDQEPALAAARLTEYFVEMGLWDEAKVSHQALLKFPANIGAQVARAQLWASVVDAEKFTAVFEPLLARIAVGADRYMPWDRRVSLAIVLARGNRLDLARTQVERCLSEATELKVRSLTTNSLYRLLLLNKALGLGIDDPKLRELALDLLPAEVRTTL